jgi:ABC-type glycerol-3-phosphate transport system substrate-binding protein
MNTWIHLAAAAGTVALAAAAAVPALAADVTLWSFLDPAADGARSAALQDVITTYEKANVDSKVTTNIVEWDQIAPSLMRGAQAGKTPDLAMVYSPDLPALIASGALMPLDACFSKIWSDEQRKDVVLLPAAKGSDGAYYGVPYELRVFGFYYRADQLDKAGIKAPQSFDDLLAAGQKAAEAGQAGLGMTFNAGGGSVEAIEWFLPMVIGAGGTILNADGTAAFNSPQMIDLLDRLHKAVTEGVLPQDVAFSSTDDVEQLAQSGRAVFIAEGSQEASSFAETATNGMKWQFMPPPAIEPGKTSPAVLNGWNLVIPKSSSNPDGACNLIKTWTSPDIQRDQAVKAGYMPMRASLANDPVLQTAGITSIPALLNYAASNPLNFAWPADTNLLNEVLSTMIQQVITGKMSNADAIAAAEQDYNSRKQ